MRTIANTVYTVEKITLQNGKEVTLKPATISLMRKGQKAMREMFEVSDNNTDATPEEMEEKFTTALVNVVQVLLKPQYKEIEDTEVAEDALDMETCYKVIEKFLGVKLNDPKLQEAAMKVLMEAEASKSSN